jgi:putative hydrolase of the HAD superfamily
MTSLRYPTILFDWGDTVMKDDPASTVPMVEWTVVEIIEGIQPVLQYLQSSGRRIVLATSAAISDEAQIRAALARVNLDRYFSRIYCFKNTGLPKGEAFYSHILEDLAIQASEVLIVGDSFEKDVLAANHAGIFAVWFNPGSYENHKSALHVTVHSMGELTSFFVSADQV